MASNVGVSAPIYAAGTISGNQPRMHRVTEQRSQTFLLGVPVKINTGGLIIEAATSAQLIAGISAEPASNLSTNGTASTVTFGSVLNESSAVNIPRGAPLNDGKIGIYAGVLDTVFHGQIGYNTTNTTLIGQEYGLTKDTDNHWYVDTTATTQGTNTCVVVVGLDANDPRGVYFTLIPLVVTNAGTLQG